MKSNQRSRKLATRANTTSDSITGSPEIILGKMETGPIASTAFTTIKLRRQYHKYSLLLENSSTTNNDRLETEHCAISNTISPVLIRRQDTNYKSDNHDYQITQRRTTSTHEKITSSTSATARYTRRKRSTITRHDRLTSYIRQSTPLVVVAATVALLLITPCIFITQTQAFLFTSSSSPSSSSASSSTQIGASSGVESPDSSSPIATSAQSPSSSGPSPAAAAAAAAIQSLSSSLLSAATGSGSSVTDGKQNGEKQSGSNSLASADGLSTSDSAKSVVASLSSAVASAAAAAAVAAAQSSLSGSDGRSLFVKKANHQHHHGERNHLAVKFVDSIPEVPYNILHNMKKVDHAAPFYNSPNKLTGSSKESLLASASSSSSSSSLNEQLGSLFKTPLWKRISDGYGEFASEFRSLFKHTRPTTMKGPATTGLTTSKILRDISVPALLMLLASAVPSEWRPIRLRRKSIPFIPQPSDPLSFSGSDMMPTYSMAPPMFAASNLNLASQPQQVQSGLLGRALNPMAQLYSQLDQTNSQQQQQQQLGTTNPLARAAAPDINLQATSNWMLQPTQSQSLQQQQQSIRRSGDIQASLLRAAAPAGAAPITATSGNQGEEGLVSNDASSTTSSQLSGQNDSDHLLRSDEDKEQKAGGLFSSFTSGLVNQVVGGHARLMGKLMNANVDSSAQVGSGDNLALDLSQYRMASLTDDQPQQTKSFVLPFYTKIMKRNMDADKHRYSLIGSDQETAIKSHHHHRLSNPISAMTQALGSIFTPSLHLVSQSNPSVTESGSSSGKKSLTTNSMNTNTNINSNLDSTLNRRNQQTYGDLLMEQRDLSQFIPQSWREVVKRTVNNVQQTASTQWRSIEGQLTNWVQDKFKAGPPSGAPHSSSGGAPAVSNMIAMGSSAVTRIFGLGGSSSNKSSTPTSTTESSRTDQSTESTNLKGKNDSQSNKSSKQPSAKGTLAGVANMIVSTFTGRPSASTTSTKAKTPSGSTTANDSATSSSSSSSTTSANQQAPSSSPGNSDSASSSMASGTSSTSAAMSLLSA